MVMVVPRDVQTIAHEAMSKLFVGGEWAVGVGVGIGNGIGIGIWTGVVVIG